MDGVSGNVAEATVLPAKGSYAGLGQVRLERQVRAM